MSPDSVVRAEAAIARACGGVGSVVEYCRSVHDVVTQVVPADRWCGFALDPPTLFATNGFHDEGVELRLMPRLLELELCSDDFNHLPALARSRSGVSILSSATGGDPAACARWRDVIAPSGLAHELRVVCRDGTRAWRALVLFRGPDCDDLDRAEEAFIAQIAPAVANGFRRMAVRQQVADGEDAREAGVLVVSTDPVEVMTVTSAATAWLDQLDDGGYGSGLPGPVMSAIHACRNDPSRVVAVRARTRAGRWVTITAERTSDRDSIGLVVQPSRPHEIATIVGAAHGLTTRESDVVVLVAAGRSNKEIAQLLGVSRHTVGDHLKNIFAKLGVTTRGEMTSKLFHDHYLPRELARDRVGVDGFFLPGRLAAEAQPA